MQTGIYPLKMVIFDSYVSLPEGTPILGNLQIIFQGCFIELKAVPRYCILHEASNTYAPWIKHGGIVLALGSNGLIGVALQNICIDFPPVFVPKLDIQHEHETSPQLPQLHPESLNRTPPDVTFFQGLGGSGAHAFLASLR